MNSTSTNLSQYFSQQLAQDLFTRIEFGSWRLSSSSFNILQDSKLSDVCGWGDALRKHQSVPGRAVSPQIDTFATGEALRTIERIQTLCQIYHKGNHAVPSTTLDEIRTEALLFLRATCAAYTKAIAQSADIVVSAPRYAKVLTAVTSNMTSADELPDTAIRHLRDIGLPLFHDRHDTLGWSWFLDRGWKAASPECGPTALLLDALTSVEHCYHSSKDPILSELISMIDAAARYICSRFEDGYHATVEELVVCMSALGAYGERVRITSELTRRRAAVVRTKHLVLLEEAFKALAAPTPLTTLRLRNPHQPPSNDPLRLDRLSDGGYDIFLYGPLLKAFLSSPTPSFRNLAVNTLRRALRSLAVAVERDEPLSIHWLSAILEAMPTTLDVALTPDQPYPEHRRFVTVPDNRVTFLIISDTQFGRDSTAHRPPLRDGSDEFDEVQPATFDQLISEAAERLTPKSLGQSAWSGLLHLGDVICRGDYLGQESEAILALRSSAATLGFPVENIVIAPGNHDMVRSGLTRDLPLVLDNIVSTPGNKPVQFRKTLLSLVRRDIFQTILPDYGFTSFCDMYSLLLHRRIRPSDGGVEIVSFLAPRLTVHIVSLWPVMRYNIDPSAPDSARRQEYGLDPKARDDVRTFLTTTQPEDIVIVLSHVPVDYLSSWSQKDDDHDLWIGAPTGEGIDNFLKYVSYPVANGEHAPTIHLILAGHMQQSPLLSRPHNVASYTAGAFHIHSTISAGAFAARLAIDEGALRIDSVSLGGIAQNKNEHRPPVLPFIIAVSNQAVAPRASDYNVVTTYDSEAADFIAATDVSGKYIELERIRAQFSALLRERFNGEDICILDVGAGAGRDTAFFLSHNFRVSAIEAAPKLAKWLRERPEGKERLSVFQVNLLDSSALSKALSGQLFHGIWMCSTLLHIPSRLDVDNTAANHLSWTDEALIALLGKHLHTKGVLYLDNKLGTGSHFKERGNILQKRWCRYRQPVDLERLISSAEMKRIAGDWYNGTNGFDAWVWILAESCVP